MGGRMRKGFGGVVTVLLCSALVACDPLPRHPENGPYEIDVLALGDSFTAGNGARVSNQEDFGYYGISADDPRPDEVIRNRESTPLHPYGCFRNINNYSFELYDAIGSSGAYVNGACTGDTTDNLVANEAPEAQLSGFSEDQREEFDVITLSIGGNDLNFATVMQQCFVGFSDSAADCEEALNYATSQLAGSPSQIYLKMRDALSRVAQDFPNARIILVGYPLIVEDENYVVSDGDLQVPAGQILEDGLNQLNSQQQALVDELNPQFSRRLTFLPLHNEDGSGLFDGHGLEGGPEEDWINPPGSIDDLPLREEWFHPNSEGHAAIAAELTNLRPLQELAGGLERVSIVTDGSTQEMQSPYLLVPSISDDGRYVAFMSESDLVADDTNGIRDAFVHDREAGVTERVSVASDGTQAEASISRYRSDFGASISANGRYVAFVSDAENLALNDTNWNDDIFVHDRVTGITELVSVASDGTQGNSDSFGTPMLSADGRYVAFWSWASSLVPDDTNVCHDLVPLCPDVFVHDRETGTTSRVSVASDGAQAEISATFSRLSPRLSISADGRNVAFTSDAHTLVDNDTNSCLPDDIYCGLDVFVHDRETTQTERVSVASDGTAANRDAESPSISADGRYVAFHSLANNLAAGSLNGLGGGHDVYLHDREAGTTERISPPSDSRDQGSMNPDVSSDGRYVGFDSSLFTSSDVDYGDDCSRCREVFVYDRQAGNIDRVTYTYGSRNPHFAVQLSADATLVAFESRVDNLTPGDTNDASDVFVQDRGPLVIG